MERDFVETLSRLWLSRGEERRGSVSGRSLKQRGRGEKKNISNAREEIQRDRERSLREREREREWKRQYRATLVPQLFRSWARYLRSRKKLELFHPAPWNFIPRLGLYLARFHEFHEQYFSLAAARVPPRSRIFPGIGRKFRETSVGNDREEVRAESLREIKVPQIE